MRRQSQRIAITASRQKPCADPITDGAPADRPSDDIEGLVLRGYHEPVLERALRRLPISYQRVLQLLTSDPTPTYEEVANVLGLPVGSIGPMRLRALAILRRDPALQRHRPATHRPTPHQPSTATPSPLPPGFANQETA